MGLPTRKPGMLVNRSVGGATPKSIRGRQLISSGSRYKAIAKALALPKTNLPMVEDEE